MSAAPRIVLIHAVEVAIAPVHAAFAETWPEARLVNLFDDSLSPDRAAEAELTPRMSGRIRTLARYAADAAADGVLFTCSAFGPAIEAAAEDLAPLPVLKPNEAMFTAALAAGSRIGMLATFAPAAETMKQEFAEAAAQAGKPDAVLRTIVVEPAMAALRKGDAEMHNHLLAEAAPALADCDAVMLAHFSTSRAVSAVSAALPGMRVLTAPVAAVEALRAALSAPRAGGAAARAGR